MYPYTLFQTDYIFKLVLDNFINQGMMWKIRDFFHGAVDIYSLL